MMPAARPKTRSTRGREPVGWRAAPRSALARQMFEEFRARMLALAQTDAGAAAVVWWMALERTGRPADRGEVG
jgi:hypothetical protein